MKSGRVVEVLGGEGGSGRVGRGGHSGESKVRALWAGRGVGVGRSEGNGGKGEEWVLSGGFDRRGFVWRVGEGGGGNQAWGLRERGRERS